MEIKGLLKKKNEVEHITAKSGKEYTKMGFVILQEGRFPKELFIETMNAGVIQFISDSSLETELSLQCEASSREWNNKYFTTVSAYAVTADKTENYGNRRSYSEQPKEEKYVAPIGNAMSDYDDSLPF